MFFNGDFIKETKKSVNAINSIRGRGYELGGNGSNENAPFDCFGMVVEYCRLKYDKDALKIARENDFPVDTYCLIYKNDPDYSKILFKVYLDRCFLKIAIPYLVIGDIVVCEADDEFTIGIYCGGQKMLVTMPDKGCFLIGTEHYLIKDAYRCLL